MIIPKKTFNKEIVMCRKLYEKQEGCQWGKCEDCGVIPLIYKLHNGEIVEGSKKVKELKEKILNNQK